MKKAEKVLKPEFKRYAKVIADAPNSKTIKVYVFDTQEEALKKAEKLKVWPYKCCVRARDEKGRLTKGWALICCK